MHHVNTKTNLFLDGCRSHLNEAFTLQSQHGSVFHSLVRTGESRVNFCAFYFSSCFRAGKRVCGIVWQPHATTRSIALNVRLPLHSKTLQLSQNYFL